MVTISYSLTEMAAQVYQANKEKGFWDNPRTMEEVIALVISEGSEALEALRKGMRADLSNFNQRQLELISSANFSVLSTSDKSEAYFNEAFKKCFEQFIKDSFEDELADIAIRLMDLMGYLNQEVEFDVNVTFTNELNSESYSVFFLNLVDELISYNKQKGLVHVIRAIKSVYWYAQSIGVKIDRHIELKLKYNALRPRLHGKKF